MPELPEVETVKRALSRKVTGKNILNVESNFVKIVASPDFKIFKKNIIGKKIESLSRRGKFLLFHLNGNKIMISHLRMTGHWLVAPKIVKNKFIHLIFQLSGGQAMAYSDIRKFGRIWLIDTKELEKFKPILKLGPEPLGTEFNFEEFSQKLAKNRSRIKVVLLNQQVVAGLGNIYVDEVLYESGVRPLRPANRLKMAEKKQIFEVIRKILAKAIKFRGTTVVNFTTPEGKGGDFQKQLKVYGKKGHKCPRCKGEIKRIVVAGRGTHYCPKCQK
ncbi:MAG: DNA-formamidopyrimidine glycosylase [bacterium]|nr:DNA-formamidopyrimidine glycosylase [bacterium]MDD5354000.1 DNA-formamidopyrimidine glycosylase [bacterium]MDD5756137.1 DNA-formamidopyrimidine glycosylase [bacterium]